MAKRDILIVEDEPIIAKDLAQTLTGLGYSVCGQAASAEKALKFLSTKSPDLAILDIAIDGETDGVELATEINRAHKVPFVFLTSFGDEATFLRARKTNPSGYILKPFDEDDLRINIELALYKRHQLSPPPIVDLAETLFVKHHHQLVKVKPDEILWAEAYDNYTYLQTDKEKYLLTATLKSVEEKLFPLGFVRLHRSYLVNLTKITSITEDYVFIEPTSAGKASTAKIPLGKFFRENLMNIITVL